MTAPQGPRRRGREHALKMLYQADLAELTAEQTMQTHWERESDEDPDVVTFSDRLVRFVLAERDSIDSLIEELAHNWSLDRIATIDRNLLRLAVGELRSEPDTPAAVVIDEAVELAKVFADIESSSFVNGLLEAARRRLRPARDEAGS